MDVCHSGINLDAPVCAVYQVSDLLKKFVSEAALVERP